MKNLITIIFAVILSSAALATDTKPKEKNPCDNGLDYWCLSKKNAKECSVSASLSVTYCNEYFKQQENALECGNGGVKFWCSHRELCGVTVGECENWLSKAPLTL